MRSLTLIEVVNDMRALAVLLNDAANDLEGVAKLFAFPTSKPKERPEVKEADFFNLADPKESQKKKKKLNPLEKEQILLLWKQKNPLTYLDQKRAKRELAKLYQVHTVAIERVLHPTSPEVMRKIRAAKSQKVQRQG